MAPFSVAFNKDMERIIRIENQRKRAYNQQVKPIVRETDSSKKQKSVSNHLISKENKSVPSQPHTFPKQTTKKEFTKADLKQGNTFRIYPNDTIINLKEQGYLNLKTKQYISEYDLFRKVLVVYGTGSNIIAKRDDTHDILIFQKEYKKFLNKGISLTQQDITSHGYSVRCFNNNVYVNTNNNSWINILTLNIVPNKTIYKNIRNVINFKGYMIAKRKNQNGPLLSIKPKLVRK